MNANGAQHDLAFHCMGSDMRVLVGEPLEPGTPSPAAAAEAVKAFLADFDRSLSRFKPGSELTALNRDPRGVVPASALLRSAVRAALWAAEQPRLKYAGFTTWRLLTGPVSPDIGPIPMAETWGRGKLFGVIGCAASPSSATRPWWNDRSGAASSATSWRSTAAGDTSCTRNEIGSCHVANTRSSSPCSPSSPAPGG